MIRKHIVNTSEKLVSVLEALAIRNISSISFLLKSVNILKSAPAVLKEGCNL